jgi:hypothetical protein
MVATYANLPKQSKTRTPNNNSKRDNLLLLPANERSTSRNAGVDKSISNAYAVTKTTSSMNQNRDRSLNRKHRHSQSAEGNRYFISKESSNAHINSFQEPVSSAQNNLKNHKLNKIRSISGKKSSGGGSRQSSRKCLLGGKKLKSSKSKDAKIMRNPITPYG